MDEIEGEKEEVFYEIRRLATLSPSPDPQVAHGSEGGLFSYRPFRGVNWLRERWHEYRQPRWGFGRKSSLFVSPNGIYVAVSIGNQVFVLRKDDDFAAPHGFFSCREQQTVFAHGIWLESQGILCLGDQLSNLYLLKADGEEITRKTRSQLKLSSPISSLFVQESLSSERTSLYAFSLITMDGVIHHVELTLASLEYTIAIRACTNLTTNGQLPRAVSCMDFHSDLSLAAVVGDSSISAKSKDRNGTSSLWILRLTGNSEVELLCVYQLEGIFTCPKDYSPLVAISPQGKFVAILDVMGCLNVFKLEGKLGSLSILPFLEKTDGMVHEKRKCIDDIAHMNWWADHILVIANKAGYVMMYNILLNKEVSLDNPFFCEPIIERVSHLHGYVFLLENTSTGEGTSTTGHTKKDLENINTDSEIREQGTERLCWNLVSFSKRSISEMYFILIKNQKYRAALDFACKHKLEVDEVYKAQWLHSSKGINEIDLYLSKIKDLLFVLSECVDGVGITEDDEKALLSHGLRMTEQYQFSNSDDSECSLIWDIRMFRLQLLQYRDKLETFLGINMGRYLAQEYCKFRSMPLVDAAVTLAESGKIGALNLLFKRHPYSTSFHVLNILSSIPETVPVQSYYQLLPGKSPPNNIIIRDSDWIECDKMAFFLKKPSKDSEKSSKIRTENILKLSEGFIWPSDTELVDWYAKRAKDIDNLSGQLENCLSLVDFACHKGISELQPFLEDISYLHQLIYSDGFVEDFVMSLVAWEQLADYEKFKVMLKGVAEDMVVRRLREIAIPFMQSRFYYEAIDSEEERKDNMESAESGDRQSFLVRWLTEVASDNRLDICLSVFENAFEDSQVDEFFKDETEAIETALKCIYLCNLTDQWIIMVSILSKVPRNTGTSNLADYSSHKLEKRLQMAEGHVEVGRLMAYYQVPKPISFFLDSHLDEKNVKQLIRLMLSKFGRRQPNRSDNDWTSMWHDMQCFQEKAFPFLDQEYILTEFIRGLLKAGKFSLARNYLKGMGSVTLPAEKAEYLVIQAAREYFFSASSLSCNEIWKAKECLSLLPNSKSVKAESDVIDALTIRLPELGVTLLPLQFRQIRNPMEIINMVITSQTGAYINIDELIEIARLLGLNSPDDVAAIQEAVSREAAVTGDLQLAFDLCLDLAKKGHGPIWDLCSAIARGPQLDKMDTESRRLLLGFALSHCDDESIGELLNAWKEVDLHLESEQLMSYTGTCPPNFSFEGSSLVPLSVYNVQDVFDLRDDFKHLKDEPNFEGVKGDNLYFDKIKDVVSKVGNGILTVDLDSMLRENMRFFSFAALELPWLHELCKNKMFVHHSNVPYSGDRYSIRMHALANIIYWLAGNNIAPDDGLIASLVKYIMEPPANKDDNILGCSFLLNLTDAFRGVEIIEELLKQSGHHEIYNIMNIGMIYSSLNDAQKECSSPHQRRSILLQKFHQKHTSNPDENDQIESMQSTFWREWNMKLEEQKKLTDQARVLNQIMPGTETSRFLSGDKEYIKGAIFSFVDSVKIEKKHILKEAIHLADTYGLQHIEVLLQFFRCALVSECWGNDDILSEISEFREDIVKCAKGVIDMIYFDVYQEIDGCDKERLSYIYSILSACFLRLRRIEDPVVETYRELGHTHMLEPFQFYKILEHECQRISFIKKLNFKNIAGLDDLNFDHFNQEICNNIQDSTVEALGKMVQALVSAYDDAQAKGLISLEGVYRHHVLGLLASLEGRNEARSKNINADELQIIIQEIELNYDSCRKYVRVLPEADMSYIIERFYRLSFPSNTSRSLPQEPTWKACLIFLLNFWIKLVDDVPDMLSSESSGESAICFETKSLSRCLKVFKSLLMDDEISANQSWDIISHYVKHGLTNGLTTNILSFVIAMIFSGVSFESIAKVYYGAELYSKCLSKDGNTMGIPQLYIHLLETILSDLSDESVGRRNLHCMVSSLSRFGCNYVEDLKMIRTAIWEKLSAFSHNMHLSSYTRMYALQLMQSIAGKNIKSLPPELVSEVEPWEEWNEDNCKSDVVTAEGTDMPGSISNTLVALKSSQLVAKISPNINISPEDLRTLASAVSCFLGLCEIVTSAESLKVLQDILEEWEELFSNRTDNAKVYDSPKESNNWSGDEWDDGWETLPEELNIDERKQNETFSVHPLHICWMEIIMKHIELSKIGIALELLDKSSSKNDTLLDEDEAQYLFQLMAERDCFVALKMLLLLPYEAPKSRCLDIIDDRFRDESVSFTSRADDHELLVLLLSSGLIRNIATGSSHQKLFSFACHSVGFLARRCQEDLLMPHDAVESRPSGHSSVIFCKVMLPYFISELVCGGQPLLAAFILSQWMHTSPSLGVIDVAEASLRRYLEGHVLQLELSGDDVDPLAEANKFIPLPFTVSRMKSKLSGQLQSALLILRNSLSNKKG